MHSQTYYAEGCHVDKQHIMDLVEEIVMTVIVTAYLQTFGDASSMYISVNERNSIERGKEKVV